MADAGAGPRSGRVVHAVDRRTRLRQNLLFYSGETAAENRRENRGSVARRCARARAR